MVEIVVEFLRVVLLVAIVALAAAAFRERRRRRDEGTRWTFLTFLVLAIVVVAGRILPEDSDDQLVRVLDKVLIAVLLLFPYFLYRLAASFRAPNKGLDRAALVSTGVVVLWALFLPEVVDADDADRPLYYQLFILVLLLDWVFLSSVVAVRFWLAGRHQPPAAQRRMRFLSVASLLLSLALIIAGETPGDAVGVDLLVQVIALLSIVGFYMSFFPPTWLRALWRRPTEEAMRGAVIELMGASDRDKVIDGLLPSAAALVASEGIAIVGPQGEVVASYGLDVGQLARADEDRPAYEEGKGAQEQQVGSDLVRLTFPFGSMLVRTNAYTPFFGRDEIEMLGSLGALANLALERVDAEALKVQLAEAQLRRQQALEINDNVVQGLAVAKYAMELGEHERARTAVEGTLKAARHIISELLHGESGDRSLEAGSLIRDQAAPGFASPAGRPQPNQSEVEGRR